MRMMLRISLLGSGRWGVELELCTVGALSWVGVLSFLGALSLLDILSLLGASFFAGSASSSLAALGLLCFNGFFTTGGGGGGVGSARKSKTIKHGPYTGARGATAHHTYQLSLPPHSPLSPPGGSEP